MLEVMRFIFSSFWVWLGTMLLLSSISGTIQRAIYVGCKRWKESP